MTHSIGESSAMAARRRTRAEFFADTNNDDDNYVLPGDSVSVAAGSQHHAPSVSTVPSSVRIGMSAMSMGGMTSSGCPGIDDEYRHTPDGKLIYGNTLVTLDSRQGRSWCVQKKYAFFGTDHNDGKKKVFCNFTFASGRKCFHKLVSPDKSTGNINRHLANDHKVYKDSPSKGEEPMQTPGALENYWSTSDLGDSVVSQRFQNPIPFSKERFRESLVRYIVESAAPFSTVTQSSLQQLLFLAHEAPSRSSLLLPSRSTITRDMKELYDKCKIHIAEELQKQNHIAYTIDGWTTPYMKASFLAVTAHWIDENWRQHAVTIGFEKITGAHTGQNLAQIMYRILEQYQLTNTPFYITMDNASNMDKLAVVLESLLQCPSVFTAKYNRIHCIGHIINLASQAALETIRAESDVVEEDEELYDKAENNTTRLESPVDRLRQGIIRIRGSPQRRETFHNMVKAECDDEAKTHPELLRDVRVRWNSTLAMLDRVISLRKAYDGFCELLATDFGRNQLDDDDWQLIRYTKRYLDSFKEFTELLSGDTYPTINLVVQAYNWLFNHLDKFQITQAGEEEEEEENPLRSIMEIDEPVFDPHDMPSDFVHATLDKAARASFQVLKKYYAAADQPVFAIAMAMDPTSKYEWWGTARWPEEWITTAKKQVQDAWDTWKDSHPLPTSDQHHVPPHQNQQQTRRPLKIRRMHPEKAPADELTKYLEEETIDEFSETIASYWARQGPTRDRLTAFARCYLSIPATSTPSERCFSKAKFYIPPSRNRLNDDNFSMSILLDSFLKYLNNT